MGVTFPKDMRIAGYRPTVFKKALLAFYRTRSPANFIALKSVFGNSRDGAIVFEECLDRGLIAFADEEYRLTEAGEAFARGSAKARTPLPKALSVLDGFLSRANALNADPDGIGYVDELWLFGSVLREEETVGDIDIAMVTSRRPGDQGNWEAFEKRIARQIGDNPDAPERLRVWWGGETWLRNYALFGKRRDGLLNGVQEGTHDLEQMGVPCRLIFDRQRGGRVTDDVLPRHPNSTGRSNTMAEPGRLGDLKPAPLRPMDARWTSQFSDWNGQVHPYVIFGGWTDETHALFPYYPQDLHVIADGNKLHSVGWVPKAIRKGNLDGRVRVAVLQTQAWVGLGIVLQRKISETPGRQVQAWVEEQAMLKVRSQLSPMVEFVGATVALIVATDMERVCRRQAEQGLRGELGIMINFENLSGPLQEQLREWVREIFDKGKVRVTPIGWNGPQVRVEIT